MNAPWPEELRVREDGRQLRISFSDATTFDLPAELLRVESPSAEVQGHGGGKITVAGKRTVAIRDMEAVGNYAVRILFDDGHDTGLYTWAYLHELGSRRNEIWARYLRALEQAGLSRDS